MANELNAGIGTTGLTVTAQLYTAGAASGAPISCTEIGSSGIYTGTMAGAAGAYGVAFLAGGTIRAFGDILWDGTAEVMLNATERNAVADAILNRDMSTGTDSGSTTVRTVRQALRALRNKWTNTGGTYTVYKEDDSTASWTGTPTTDAAAVPITGNDPAGP